MKKKNKVLLVVFLIFLLLVISIFIFSFLFNKKDITNYSDNDDIKLADNADIYDVVLMWGQSNMTGSAGSNPSKKDNDNNIIYGEDAPDQNIYNGENVDSTKKSEFIKYTGIKKEIVNNYTKVNHVNVSIQSGTVYEYLLGSNKLNEIEANTSKVGEYITCIEKNSKKECTEYAYGTDNVVKRTYNKLSSGEDKKFSFFALQQSKGTNMAAQFGKDYYELTGHKVVIVMASNGGEYIENFLKRDKLIKYHTDIDGNYFGQGDCNALIDADKKQCYEEYFNQYIYEAMVKKYKAAVKKLTDENKTIGNKFYVVYQGESDVNAYSIVQLSDRAGYHSNNNSTNNSPTEYYKEIFKEVHNDLKKDLGLGFGAIVEIGHTNKMSSTSYGNLLEVHQAQEQLIQENDDIILASDFPFENLVPNKATFLDKEIFGSSKYNYLYPIYGNNDEKFNVAIESANLSVCNTAVHANLVHLNSAALSQIGFETAINANNYLNNYSIEIANLPDTLKTHYQYLARIIPKQMVGLKVEYKKGSDILKILEVIVNSKSEYVISCVGQGCEKDELPITDFTFTGLKYNVVGKQTITLTYNNLRTTFFMDVKDIEDDNALENVIEVKTKELTRIVRTSKSDNPILPMQGIVFTDKYIVYAGFTKDEDPTVITVIDRNTKEVLLKDNTKVIGHANDIAYNADNNTFYIVYGASYAVKNNLIHKILPFQIVEKNGEISISYLDTVNGPSSFSGITYDYDHKKYIGYTNGNVYIFDLNNETAEKSFKIKTNLDDLANQGIAYYNNHIFLSHAVTTYNSGFILVYDLEGNYEGALYIPSSSYIGHLEGISIDRDGKMLLGYNIHTTIANAQGETPYVAFVEVDTASLIPTKPTIKANDNITSGKWHTANVTIIPSGSKVGNSTENIDYFWWRSGKEPANFSTEPLSTTKENTKGTRYYIKACNSIMKSFCSSYVSYDMYIDKTKPTITLSQNENKTSQKEHNVTVSIIENGSGLASGGIVEYGWSKTTTTAPTSYTKATLNYTAGTVDQVTFMAKGTGLNGKHYLWIKPNVKDVAGNVNNTIIKSTGQFYFPELVDFPICQDKIYTGASQTLFAAHSGVGYTNAVLKGTNVNSYTVTLTPEANYEWSSGSNTSSARTLTCKIVKSDTTTSLGEIAKTYTGNAQAATGAIAKLSSNNSTISGATVTYKYYSNSTCTSGETSTSPTNVGTYYVKVTLTGTNNYNSSVSDCVKYTIIESGEIKLIDLLKNNNYSVKNNYVMGFTIGNTINELKTQLGNDITIESKTTIVSTGTIIKKDNESYTIVIKGDINGDGKIGALDYVAIRKHMLGTKIINNNEIEFLAVDTNSDDKISALDYINIRKIMMGE